MKLWTTNKNSIIALGVLAPIAGYMVYSNLLSGRVTAVDGDSLTVALDAGVSVAARGKYAVGPQAGEGIAQAGVQLVPLR